MPRATVVQHAYDKACFLFSSDRVLVKMSRREVAVSRKHQFSIGTNAARKINRLIVSANGIGSRNIAAFRHWETATWIVRVREMSDGRTVNAVANCFQLSTELSTHDPGI